MNGPDSFEDRSRALATDLVVLLADPECDVALDGQPAVAVPPTRWRDAASLAVETLGCDFFDWLTAVDERPDIELALHLRSVSRRAGLLIRTVIAVDPPDIDSLVDVSAGAAWHEREVHEMFDVGFRGHLDPEPLLLPPGFAGHPLRKDFALTARLDTAWPGAVDPASSGRARRRARPPGVSAHWSGGVDSPSDGTDPR